MVKKKEINTYILQCSGFATIFENRTPSTKPSSKERVMKISKRFQPQNAECMNQ